VDKSATLTVGIRATIALKTKSLPGAIFSIVIFGMPIVSIFSSCTALKKILSNDFLHRFFDDFYFAQLLFHHVIGCLARAEAFDGGAFGRRTAAFSRSS